MGNEQEWKKLVTMVNDSYSNETEIILSIETENFTALISVVPDNVEEHDEKLFIFCGYDIYHINRGSMEYDNECDRFICEGSGYTITITNTVEY